MKNVTSLIFSGFNVNDASNSVYFTFLSDGEYGTFSKQNSDAPIIGFNDEKSFLDAAYEYLNTEGNLVSGVSVNGEMINNYSEVLLVILESLLRQIENQSQG